MVGEGAAGACVSGAGEEGGAEAEAGGLEGTEARDVRVV